MFIYTVAGPILSTADIFHEEQYRQRNMIENARPPGGDRTCFPGQPEKPETNAMHAVQEPTYTQLHMQACQLCCN